MIMQSPGGNDFFSDFLNRPPATALHEADAPVTDWRFVPQRIGRKRLRMDIPHAVAVSMKPRLPQGRPLVQSLTRQPASTLYFG